MGADVKDSIAGGIVSSFLQKFLQGSGSINPTVWRGFLDDVPYIGDETERVPPKGGLPAGKM